MSATNSLRTPVGDLRVGRDDGSNFIAGTFDYLRVYNYTKSDHADRLIRCPNPRALYVLADYGFKASSSGLAEDRSRYENNLIAQNSPSNATTLCHNPAALRAINMFVDENNKQQVLLVSGSKYYLAEVA